MTARETPLCVVFDVDDTLYLERDYVRSGFRALDALARERWGLTGFGELAWSAFEAGVRGRIFDHVLAELDFTAPGVVPELVAAYRSHVPAIALLPDAREVLEALHARRIPIAYLTDGPLESQRAKVTALRAPPGEVVYTAELGPGGGKPSPLGFQRIEARVGARGAACWYVADNPLKDFVAPRALGWHTLRVRRPGGLHEHVPSGDDVEHEARDLGGFVERVLATGAA